MFLFIHIGQIDDAHVTEAPADDLPMVVKAYLNYPILLQAVETAGGEVRRETRC
jgi:hypothetical protein